MHIPFSPPDITDAEVREVAQALLSGWITTGPRTKELEPGQRWTSYYTAQIYAC